LSHSHRQKSRFETSCFLNGVFEFVLRAKNETIKPVMSFGHSIIKQIHVLIQYSKKIAIIESLVWSQTD
jgi:hypothetical protein